MTSGIAAAWVPLAWPLAGALLLMYPERQVTLIETFFVTGPEGGAMRPGRHMKSSQPSALGGQPMKRSSLITLSVTGPVQVPHAALFGLAGGVAAALFFRKRDEKECGAVRRDQSADGSSRKGA